MLDVHVIMQTANKTPSFSLTSKVKGFCFLAAKYNNNFLAVRNKYL